MSEFKSWKIEVTTDGGKSWAGNAMRYADKKSAEVAARDLMMRWLSVTDWRVAESEDEPKYRIVKTAEGYWKEEKVNG